MLQPICLHTGACHTCENTRGDGFSRYIMLAIVTIETNWTPSCLNTFFCSRFSESLWTLPVHTVNYAWFTHSEGHTCTRGQGGSWSARPEIHRSSDDSTESYISSQSSREVKRKIICFCWQVDNSKTPDNNSAWCLSLSAGATFGLYAWTEQLQVKRFSPS